jgi:capsular exopolysaccharide synthesis family protein
MRQNDGALESTLRVLRRRKLIILTALIAVPLAAFLYSSSQTKEYTASATLLFESEEETGLNEAARFTATIEGLAQLPAVAAEAAKSLHVDPTALGGVEVGSGNENANLTTISATSESPEQAAEIANAYARATVSFQRRSSQAKVKAKISVLEKRIESVTAAEPNSPKIALLQEQLETLEVEEALQTGEISLVQEASPPTSASRPRTKRNVILGLLLGVVLGLGLAALVERLDRRVRGVNELAELFRLPIIGRIPKNKAFRDAPVISMLQAPEAEAFRSLRANLRYLKLINNDLHSLLIASPQPNDGKSTVARGLAGAMAETGDDVLLIEGDLRKESSFRTDPSYRGLGLSSVLAGTPLDEALIQVPVGRGRGATPILNVLPAGPIVPNPAALLESERMREVFDELLERFEMVIVDSPAIGVVSDAMALVTLTSGSIAIGALGRTTREGAYGFVEQLELTGNRPLGLVVTMAEESRNKYAYYRPSGALTKG